MALADVKRPSGGIGRTSSRREEAVTVSIRRLALFVVFLLAASACAPVVAPSTTAGGSAAAPSGSSATASASSAEKVELTMWNSPVSEPYNQWWADYIKEFNASHPNIQVKSETFESEPYKAKIQSALVNGTAPDIFFMIPGPQGVELFKEGKMATLGDYIDSNAFVPSARDKCSVDGKLACLPMYIAP